jgi:hypothetical protein
MIGQFVSILHTTTCDLYFTGKVPRIYVVYTPPKSMCKFRGYAGGQIVAGERREMGGRIKVGNWSGAGHIAVSYIIMIHFLRIVTSVQAGANENARACVVHPTSCSYTAPCHLGSIP